MKSKTEKAKAAARQRRLNEKRRSQGRKILGGLWPLEEHHAQVKEAAQKLIEELENEDN